MALKVAFITGITGQVGSYLAEMLLSKGYEVHGLVRRASSPNLSRISHIQSSVHLHVGDICDATCLQNILNIVRPHEVYNLAAQSFVVSSFDMPLYTVQASGVGVINILEAIRGAGLIDKTRFLQASSSEMFGKVRATPQDEETPFYPRSMYGIAKLMGYWSVRNYRETYGMFAANSICHNKESPRRGEEFVTKKISKGVAAILKGKIECLKLGNLNAERDWMSAQEAVEAMWKILQQDVADDFVLASGVTTSVRRFVELCFEAAGQSLTWSGTGEQEIGTISTGDRQGQCVVRIDRTLYRPCEVDLLLGDASKAKRVLGWETNLTVADIATAMVQHDMAEIKAD